MGLWLTGRRARRTRERGRAALGTYSHSDWQTREALSRAARDVGQQGLAWWISQWEGLGGWNKGRSGGFLFSLLRTSTRARLWQSRRRRSDDEHDDSAIERSFANSLNMTYPCIIRIAPPTSKT